MPRQQIRYRLDNGRRMTVRQIEGLPQNTWPLSYQVIYERLKRGERALERLLRPPNDDRKLTHKSRANRVSPWRLGNAVRTERARRKTEAFLEDRRREIKRESGIDLTGARYGNLTILHPGPVVGGKSTWTCLCDCGNRVTYRQDTLDHREAENCGCSEERRKTA